MNPHQPDIAADTATALRLTAALHAGDRPSWQAELDALSENGRAIPTLCCAATLLLKACHMLATTGGYTPDLWLSTLVIDQLDEAKGE